jgi:hypothetical protein
LDLNASIQVRMAREPIVSFALIGKPMAEAVMGTAHKEFLK